MLISLSLSDRLFIIRKCTMEPTKLVMLHSTTNTPARSWPLLWRYCAIQMHFGFRASLLQVHVCIVTMIVEGKVALLLSWESYVASVCSCELPDGNSFSHTVPLDLSRLARGKNRSPLRESPLKLVEWSVSECPTSRRSTSSVVVVCFAVLVLVRLKTHAFERSFTPGPYYIVQSFLSS